MLLPDVFYSMTWQEYAYYSHGVMMRDCKQWEHTRLIAAAVYSTVSKKPVKPTDIIKLPTDSKAPKLDIEEMKRRWEQGKEYAKILNMKMKHGAGRNKRQVRS